jgi:hypothetical protein
MSHSFVLTRNCRKSLTPSRLGRKALAEKLDKQWRELRRHATIERDPGILLRLAAELDKRKRAEGAGNGN